MQSSDKFIIYNKIVNGLANASDEVGKDAAKRTHKENEREGDISKPKIHRCDLASS